MDEKRKENVTVRSASSLFTRAEDARDGTFFTVYRELIRYRSVVILPERSGCSKLL